MTAHVDLRFERSLMRGGAGHVAGMDEVGRGAIAGPVSVGVVVISTGQAAAPAGVRDSKELRPAVREGLVAPIVEWAGASAVGHASAQEVDDHGVVAALRLAGRRALTCAEGDLGTSVDVVLLDGSHDWLTMPTQGDLFEADLAGPQWQVVTKVKADRTCASVAAASILAKVERDRIMAELGTQWPEFGWSGNKGYGSTEHMEAVRIHGPCVEHRRTWKLPS